MYGIAPSTCIYSCTCSTCTYTWLTFIHIYPNGRPHCLGDRNSNISIHSTHTGHTLHTAQRNVSENNKKRRSPKKWRMSKRAHAQHFIISHVAWILVLIIFRNNSCVRSFSPNHRYILFICCLLPIHPMCDCRCAQISGEASFKATHQIMNNREQCSALHKKCTIETIFNECRYPCHSSHMIIT